MKSSALIPLVFLTMACSVQAAELPAPAGPPVTNFRGTCESDPDGTKFAAKACYTAYDPYYAGKKKNYKRPTCDATHPVNDLQRQILAKAYSRSPDYVKAKLCRLTKLFVTTYAGYGWGFWEAPDRPPSLGVYVAISERNLGGTKTLSEAEDEIVRELLNIPAGGRHVGRGLLRLQTADPTDPDLAVLAALAHELGHVLLADANVDGTDRRNPRTKLVGPPQSACFESAILDSWDANLFHRHMQRWVLFGDQNHNRPKSHKIAFSLKRLQHFAHSGRFAAVNDVIRKVYDSKEFVSLPAAIRPEEDLIETYKYKVLMDATPNQPIVFRLGDREINVSDYLKSEVPAKKVDCLRDFGFLSGQP
jgi:hypothetical protein